MTEKILRIEEIREKDGWCSQSGYAVITDKQTIKLKIDDVQCCCENAGYFMSNDKLDDFIGAELLGISLTDKALKEVDFEKQGCSSPDNEWFQGGIMFVDIKTSKGVLQFVAYNEHNGYYGHEAYVVSTQLKHSESL